MKRPNVNIIDHESEQASKLTPVKNCPWNYIRSHYWKRLSGVSNIWGTCLVSIPLPAKAMINCREKGKIPGRGRVLQQPSTNNNTPIPCNGHLSRVINMYLGPPTYHKATEPPKDLQAED